MGNNMSQKRRTKIEIIRDVLEIMRNRGSVKKTEIVYGANLNFGSASGILKMANQIIAITNSPPSR